MPLHALPLSGKWLLRPDPGYVGLAEHWPGEPLDRDRWKPATLPSAWQAALGLHFHAAAWYRRHITLPDRWPHARTTLRIDAAATDAAVFVNSSPVARHVGDSLPFDADLTAFARPGETLDLCIRVDERLGHHTKGFHDMLSLHHGGLWQPLTLIGSSRLHLPPDWLSYTWNPDDRTLRITADLSDDHGAGRARFILTDPAGRTLEQSAAVAEAEAHISVEFTIAEPHLWSPDSPHRYTLDLQLADDSGITDEHRTHIGLRTVRITDRRFLLNDRPIHLRGILDWGHEPARLAPDRSEARIRDDFARLRALGFNALCLCMWYPPRIFHDIADEMGMLLWQIHPLWHCPMTPDLMEDYRRLFTGFFRRDRAHPSVVLVSATCEHPRFDPDLARWWWEESARQLPGIARQVQTSSFAWADLERTDLYDEHTYENCDRWPAYLREVQKTLDTLTPRRPFIMGETAVFADWPDVQTLHESVGDSRPWWLPNIFDDALNFEADIEARYGADTLTRFRRQARRQNLLGRKFQIERFREHDNFVGLVMNHLNDVPACTCGFRDDAGRWRFSPEETRGFLADAPLLLITPDHRRSFAAGETIPAHVALSNASARAFDGPLTVAAADAHLADVHLCAQPGEVASAPISLTASDDTAPCRTPITLAAPGLTTNTVDLWSFPAPDFSALRAHNIARLTGLPFTDAEREPDPVERGYSRGFGLPAPHFRSRLPDPHTLAPGLPAVEPCKSVPRGTLLILTHRLTPETLDFALAGGSILLLASKAHGALGTEYQWLFGQVPLVIEQGPIHPGDSEWIVDLLHFDLTRTYCRVIPTQRLGLLDCVAPLIRLVYTHDQQRLTFFDLLFAARLGQGTLIVSSLDHHDPAGQFLLHRLLRWGIAPDLDLPALDPARLCCAVNDSP